MSDTVDWDRVVCRLDEVEMRSPLFTIGAGTLYLGQLANRPCLFVTTQALQDWVEELWEGPELAPDAAVAYCFESGAARAACIRARGWHRRVDGYLKEELWSWFEQNAPRGVTREEFEVAYADARDAIRELPCEGCGAIAWPVISKPESGSAEWWDDPSPGFSCRECGLYLADPFAYPVIREPTRDYPYDGVVDRSKLPDVDYGQ